VKLQASGADVFMSMGTPKFAAQAIGKVHQLGWQPVHIVNNVSSSVGSVLKPAGLDAAKGVLSTAYDRDPTDLAWTNDAGMKEWSAFMDKYFPDGDRTSSFTVYGYTVAQTLAHVLKQAGEDLARENVLKQAANLKNFTVPTLLPGVTMNTSVSDLFPIEQMQMMRFNGERWELFGPVIAGEIGG
jgi:branched-chain amino acid transport system substrate-binding protein